MKINEKRHQVLVTENDMDRYVSVMLFRGVSDAVDELLSDIGYWPNRAEFLREAALEKIRIERQSLKDASWINRSKETDKRLQP